MKSSAQYFGCRALIARQRGAMGTNPLPQGLFARTNYLFLYVEAYRVDCSRLGLACNSWADLLQGRISTRRGCYTRSALHIQLLPSACAASWTRLAPPCWQCACSCTLQHPIFAPNKQTNSALLQTPLATNTTTAFLLSPRYS